MPVIDVHHHYFPDSINKAGHNKLWGWKTPEDHLPWTPEVSLKAMDASGIDKAILSLPALPVFEPGQDPRNITRQRNEDIARIRDQHPIRFGFFASLPSLDDIKGCIAEIAFALDTLQADGIALASCSGVNSDAKYLGDESFDPIFAELHSRSAVVFLHGSSIPSSTPYPHEHLGIPICETPNETFKAAAHLVVTGRKRKYPNIKIILAHLGGTTPFLAGRVAVLSSYMGCTLSIEEVLADFKTFYYETALSSYETNMCAMDNFVTRDRILFGTDLPAVSVNTATWYTEHLKEYHAQNEGALADVLFGNARRLGL